jgi:hypothetical protein
VEQLSQLPLISYAGGVSVSVGASAVSSTMHMSETKARRMSIFLLVRDVQSELFFLK